MSSSFARRRRTPKIAVLRFQRRVVDTNLTPTIAMP
jgi:hypothetical protein